MQSIIYESINEKFGYGEYLGFKVIIMKENGYINATRMLKNIEEITGKRKDFHDWKRIQQAQELIEAVENDLKAVRGISVSAFYTEKGGIQEFQYLQGSYVHPDIIVHIASWASPKIGIKVSRIVNARVIQDYKKQIQEKEEELVLRGEELKRYQYYLDSMKEYILIYHEPTAIDDVYYISRVNERSKPTIESRARVKNYKLLHEIPMTRNSIELYYNLRKGLQARELVVAVDNNRIRIKNSYTLEKFVEDINNSHL